MLFRLHLWGPPLYPLLEPTPMAQTSNPNPHLAGLSGWPVVAGLAVTLAGAGYLLLAVPLMVGLVGVAALVTLPWLAVGAAVRAGTVSLDTVAAVRAADLPHPRFARPTSTSERLASPMADS